MVASIVLTVFADVAPADSSYGVHQLEDLVDSAPTTASLQHLQAYLNEFTFRFNRRFHPFNAFRSLLGIAGEATAPTYEALYSGEWWHPTVATMGENRAST